MWEKERRRRCAGSAGSEFEICDPSSARQVPPSLSFLPHRRFFLSALSRSPPPPSLDLPCSSRPPRSSRRQTQPPRDPILHPSLPRPTAVPQMSDPSLATLPPPPDVSMVSPGGLSSGLPLDASVPPTSLLGQLAPPTRPMKTTAAGAILTGGYNTVNFIPPSWPDVPRASSDRAN